MPKNVLQELTLPGFYTAPANCSNHREHRMGYAEFFAYAEARQKEGVEQIQCANCGLWVFPSHWNREALRKQQAIEVALRKN